MVLKSKTQEVYSTSRHRLLIISELPVFTAQPVLDLERASSAPAAH
jgi:hypothetical protein